MENALSINKKSAQINWKNLLCKIRIPLCKNGKSAQKK
jgi:hypothetical protein